MTGDTERGRAGRDEVASLIDDLDLAARMLRATSVPGAAAVAAGYDRQRAALEALSTTTRGEGGPEDREWGAFGNSF